MYHQRVMNPPEKKKKAPKNAFFFFMMELKQQEERQRGRPVSMGEIQSLANEPWSRMTQEEKKAYSNMAANEKRARLGDLDTKFTSLGRTFAEIDEEERNLKENKMIIDRTIKNVVKELDENGIRNHKFYVCHVNYYFKFDEKFRPAEIAVIEFSLQDGITNTYHAFLDPGEIPLGYRRQAMVRTKEVHGIPVSGSQLSTRNYAQVFNEIVPFVTQNRKIEPIYTVMDDENKNTSLTAVTDALNFLTESVGAPSNVFRVFPLNKLLYELKNKCSDMNRSDKDKFPTLAIVDAELEKDTFSSFSNLACEFHENDAEDVALVNCSFSITKRWVYTLCDHCCKLLTIPMKSGQHCPTETDTNWQTNKVKKNEWQSMSELSLSDKKKLKEERGRQFDEHEQRRILEKSEEVRPPTHGFRGTGPTADRLNPSDFPQLGSRGRGCEPSTSNQQTIYWAVKNRRGQGRGTLDNGQFN